MFVQHRAARFGIGQPAEKVRASDRRVMNQYDAERLLALQSIQQRAKAPELLAVQLAGRGEWQRRQRCREPDQRHRPAPSNEREIFAVVALHKRAPMLLSECLRLAYVGVVVAGHERDIVGHAQGTQPIARPYELAWQRQIRTRSPVTAM